MVIWRELTLDESLKFANDSLLEQMFKLLGNNDFNILGVMNEDGKEKAVFNFTGYRKQLEDLGVKYNSYYDEDHEMEIRYPDNELLKSEVFEFIKREIYQEFEYNMEVKSTVLDLEDFSINIRVEVLI